VGVLERPSPGTVPLLLHFTIENLPARLSRLKQDPWADIAKTKQSITAAMLKRLAAR
jgi:DNA primase